jgi:hypothetical protein
VQLPFHCLVARQQMHLAGCSVYSYEVVLRLFG